MGAQLLDWEINVIHNTMTKEARIKRVTDYIDGLYQQFQIDPEQYRTLIRLVNNINKENSSATNA